MCIRDRVMIARPDFIKLNGLVKVNGFVGRIVDLAESEQSLSLIHISEPTRPY